MIKWIKIFITFWITSFFLFPVVFNAFPVMNTKTFMAAVGLVFIGYDLITKKEKFIPKNLFPLFMIAAIVSLAGIFSMTYNNTIDDAYSGYLTSMAVWLSAAYVVCSLIRISHGKISVELLCEYVIAVCVMQCISCLMIDNMPSVQRVFDTYVNIDQRTLHEIDRLYGFGANLDVAGTKFSACLIMVVAMVMKQKDTISDSKLLYYVAAFGLITVVGSMISRTTYVGVGLAAAYVVMTTDYSSTVTYATLRKFLTVLATVFLVIIACVYFYNHDANFHYWIRFAFESFFNLFERGEFSSASTNTLKDMYVFPDNPKTWLIGDGYFSNPYWSDWTYTYIHQNKRGFYMGTDVGYLRFIFYFGVVGLAAFSIFMCKAAQTCADKCKKYTALFFFVLIANFVVWLKVATDLFLVFALFICTVNMMPDESEDENVKQLETANDE